MPRLRAQCRYLVVRSGQGDMDVAQQGDPLSNKEGRGSCKLAEVELKGCFIENDAMSQIKNELKKTIM